LSYAGLLIVTLHYAAVNSRKTGIRIGISRSVEQVGPLVVMALGTWVASYVGPQHVFFYMGSLSALGVIIAFFLVELDEVKELPNLRLKKFFIPKPKSIDSLIFWMGFGIDGLFTVTIALMWVQYSTPEKAIVIGGLILAARRVSEMMIAPISGKISDRLGGSVPLLLMLSLCGLGFFLIGTGNLILGSVALVVCRGALGTLFPAATAKLYFEDTMIALTRNQTWRDIGAAAGPLLTGVLLELMSAELIHLLVFGLFMITSGWFFFSDDFKRLSA
jgi:DHA1 family inner membrane transport protein